MGFLNRLFGQQTQVVVKESAAVSSLRKQAENGDAEAQYRLGDAYAHGDGVPQSIQIAGKWWSLAAEQGNAKAQADLGGAYYFIDEKLGPKLSIRMGTSNTPPIFAYKDGQWGWEQLLKYIDFEPDTDKLSMLVLANYDRVNRRMNITPQFTEDENAKLAIKMLHDGDEGKVTLPKYLELIEAAREVDKMKSEFTSKP